MADEFATGLSLLGFAFQFRVAAEIEQMRAKKLMDPWQLVGTEVPVALGALHTRIDLVLEKKAAPDWTRFVAIECKRVNPKFGRWCFAKSPYPYPEYAAGQLAVEGVRLGSGDHVEIETRGGDYSQQCYHVGFALKMKDARGDASPVANDQDAIEAACGQVCLGASGLTRALLDRGYMGASGGCRGFFVLPMIVTTATLYATNVSLADADLATGAIDMDENAVQELPWLVYQYMQSPSRVISDGRIHERPDEILGHVAGDALRSVAVVNACHMDKFFRFFDKRW